MIEASLSLNSLNQNHQYIGDNAIIKQIYNLLLMVPGTDPLNLDKGCDTTSYYYQTKDNGRISELEQRIQDQIHTYTPYKVNNVICRGLKNNEDKWILHILITFFAGINILFSTDGEKTSANSVNINKKSNI